ncbi:MAG: L-lactate permease [Chloroflexi bacterium]|nr:L-lactate permease [Chloroflexota bacterium]
MSVFVAILPILIVLVLMLFFHSGSHLAGFAGWLVGLIVAFVAFGLNLQVLMVSQIKSLLVTMNVLLVLWPALFLYHLVDQVGGIRAIAVALQNVIPDPGWLRVIQAWMVTAVIENLAGFGLPIAIGAPMLVAMGVPPITAVAASAIGHSWAVSTSGMALAFRTLVDVTRVNAVELFPTTAFFLGIAVLLTGLAVSILLGQKKHWWRVILVAILVGGTQYVMGVLGMISISSFSSAVAGILGGILLIKRPGGVHSKPPAAPALKTGLFAYGLLIVIIMTVTVVKPIHQQLGSVSWTLYFPEVVTSLGVSTPAGNGFLFHPFLHPGVLILATALISAFFLPRTGSLPIGKIAPCLRLAAKAAIPASLGTLFMVALSSMMEHTGMTMQIAKGLSDLMGMVYPLFSPLIGMIGSFATGSNTNSNVLFGSLQKGVADLLKISPILILSAQTVGGSLGSMIAPAKLAIGSSTSASKGLEGKVLRITLPIGLGISFVIGLTALLMR